MLGKPAPFAKPIPWIPRIHGMNPRDVDLNLLVIFDAMARHRSVSRTADAVGLSQPATSAALARLRAVFDDALFVRAGAQMEPTPRAAGSRSRADRMSEEISPATRRSLASPSMS